MRIIALIICVTVLLASSIAAQESEFPTLAALENLEIPGYSYVDAVRRLSWIDANYTPPTDAPAYSIGDRGTYMLPVDAFGTQGATPVELRGQTESVLIWVEDSANYSRFQAQTLAERLEYEVLLPLQELFDFVQPPGIDGDPRLTVTIFLDVELPFVGGFARAYTYPRSLFADSNQSEFVLVNLGGGGKPLRDDEIIDIVAHEHQHVLLHHRDFDEELWLNEALSGYADYYTPGMDTILRQADEFLAAPETGLTQFHLAEDESLKYGAGALFMVYLAERYGDEAIRRLHAESADGWQSVEKALRESTGDSADEVFADWVLANLLLDANRGYGYQILDSLLTPPEPSATFDSFPAAHSGSLAQYSSEYLAIRVRGAERLALRLEQAPEARLIETTPYNGDFFQYAATAHIGNSKLTRAFDLTGLKRNVWLEYRVWHELAKGHEYAYVEISEDDGKSWYILSGKHTEGKDDFVRFYSNGYTGKSDGWLEERVNLSAFAGHEVLLRFEVMTDEKTTYKGMAIDDIRIDAIGFYDGFETADDAWIEEGWIRTDNRLPQRAWLQVVQENDEGLHLSRYMMTSSGEVEIDVLPGVTQALVAISPVVPQTSLETEYTLEVNLLNADGALMAAPNDCKITTTTGLNFRDAPGGGKIGLLPVGTAVYALDSRDGWYNVEYDGLSGWVHGDYVRTEGNCEF